MKKTNNYQLEDFISKSEELLSDIDNINCLVDTAVGNTTEKISDDLSLTSPEAIKESMDLQFDGYTEVWLTDNEMSAVVDFHPPTGAKNPIDPDAVNELLNTKGIIEGVDWDIIREAVFSCNTRRIRVTDVVVARGTKPIDEVPEHLLIEEQLIKKSRGPEDDSIRIDFKEASPYILVKEGQELAKYIPNRPGRMGITVLGKAVPYKTKKITKIVPGSHTRLQGKSIIADCDGIFSYNENTFQVKEVMELAGDVDYKTGHINFPGDVIIRGEVKDCFKVHSGGTVYCYKTLDASEVISGKDLIVHQGIIGKNKGRIKAGGKVIAKFIENCHVEAGEQVQVENGILNSAIYTLKQLELSKRGVIIGGRICAQDGVTAFQIGSATGPRTEIYCGIDYSVEKNLKLIQDKSIELALKLRQVEGKLKKSSAESEKLQQIKDKIKLTIHKLNETTNSLIFQLDKNEKAEVVVKGVIFPGAYIEICHLSYIVPRQMERVRFKIDKLKGKIVVESLANDRSLLNVRKSGK